MADAIAENVPRRNSAPHEHRRCAVRRTERVTLYLDASAMVPLLVDEGASRAVGDYLSKASEAFIVSEFAAAEALDVRVDCLA